MISEVGEHPNPPEREDENQVAIPPQSVDTAMPKPKIEACEDKAHSIPKRQSGSPDRNPGSTLKAAAQSSCRLSTSYRLPGPPVVTQPLPTRSTRRVPPLAVDRSAPVWNSLVHSLPITTQPIIQWDHVKDKEDGGDGGG